MALGLVRQSVRTLLLIRMGAYEGCAWLESPLNLAAVGLGWLGRLPHSCAGWARLERLG